MTLTMEDLAHVSPAEARKAIREGQWPKPTSGLCRGRVQGNLVILPKDWAYDFLVFAQRNPKPCPVLDVTEPGDPEPRLVAPGADLRTDIPKYRVWKDGKLTAEPANILEYWRDDLVAFLLGCSFSFEGALVEAGVPVRHIDAGRNVAMYTTDRPCRPTARMAGPLVVSMRPFKAVDAIRAIQITTRFPQVHGAPVHLGDPALIGIADLSRPDYGDAVPVHDDDIPVFWACGVTPQAVIAASRPAFCITHAPGHMLVTDLKNHQLAIL